MSKARNPIVALALVVVAAMLLAACGESNSSATGDTASGAHIVKSSDPISDTASAPSEARFPEGEENDEVSPTGAGPVKPCSFVPSEEASAILGAPVRVTTGKQGPTCIYETPESKRVMTLVVERISLPSLRNHASAVTRVAVAGRAGWCLRYQSTSLVVPLAEGNVLNVTGPCKAATRFAARAIPRIAS
jgi:predicted small secreted protein